MTEKTREGYDSFILKKAGTDHKFSGTDLLLYREKSDRSGMEFIFSINPCQEHGYISLLNSKTNFRVFLKLIRKTGEYFELRRNFDSLNAIKYWLRGAELRLSIFASLFKKTKTVSRKTSMKKRFGPFLRSSEGTFINRSLSECLSSLRKIKEPKDKPKDKFDKPDKPKDEKYSHHKKMGSGC